MVASMVMSHCLCIISLSALSESFLAPLPHRRVLLLPSAPSYYDYSLHSSLPSGPSDRRPPSPPSPLGQNDVVRPDQAVMGVREIMSLLRRTYPQCSDDQGWIKTRKYLYQYCASTAPRTKNDIPAEGQMKPKRRNNRGPLTLSDMQRLLSFLQTTFPNHPELQAQILQRTPRILGQTSSIESRMIPTVDFLQGLYGDMGAGGSDGKNKDGGMFIEAISRNTDLLLVRGVGYAGNRGSKCNRNAVEHEGDGCNTLAVEDYLQRELSVSSSGISKLKNNHPTLFQLSLNGKVKPAVRYLYSLIGHGDARTTQQTKRTKQVAKMITNHPMLLQLDVGANLEPTACFLRNACDLTDTELANVIVATPGVLGLSVEENLKPTIRFLRDMLESGGVKLRKGDGHINGSETDDGWRILLRKCILKHPQILALSLKNLMAKRDYFDGIDRHDHLPANDVDKNATETKPRLAARILVGAPSTYSLSLKKNIIPKIEYLGRLWGIGGNCNPGGSNSPLSDNLGEYPQILTLSKEGNIIPTLSFYNMTGYINLDVNGLPREQQRSLTMQPKPPKIIIRSRYIASSLYNRLLPRWHFLLEQEKQHQLEQLERKLDPIVDPNSNEARKYTMPEAAAPPNVALPPLHLLAGASDDVFCRQMKLSRKDYLAFKEEAVPRLKFSSQFDRWLKTGRPIDLILSNEAK